jgi:hypothetical protein
MYNRRAPSSAEQSQDGSSLCTRRRALGRYDRRRLVNCPAQLLLIDVKCIGPIRTFYDRRYNTLPSTNRLWLSQSLPMRVQWDAISPHAESDAVYVNAPTRNSRFTKVVGGEHQEVELVG